jgi:hypothetical protein
LYEGRGWETPSFTEKRGPYKTGHESYRSGEGVEGEKREREKKK